MPRDCTRDVVRGLTSLEMTFVNVSSLRWTSHSGYIGHTTYADTIFPCFAFLSGMSPAPARRNLGLVGVGLGLHTLSATVNRKPVVRIPGVLQRLGVASLIANEPCFAFLRRYHGAPLVILWYAITLLGASKISANNPLAHPDYAGADAAGIAQTRIDRLLFGDRLLAPSFDPEGLLGCLTTAVSMLVGRSFEEQKELPASQKIMTGIGMIAAGEALHLLLPKFAPISKGLWTPSFLLVTSGVSILKYLVLENVLPYLPAAVRNLLEAVGKRSLETYAISTLLIMLFKLRGNKSFMASGVGFLGSVIGPGWADFIMSLGLTGAVAAAANFLVSTDLRLRW